jgi:uncharacterized protein YxjI
MLTGTHFAIEKKVVALADTFQVNDESGNLLVTVTRNELNFTFNDANGAQIGEIRGSQPNRKLPDHDELYEFQVLDEQGKLIAAIKQKAYPHERTGFLKGAAWNFDFSWCVEGPAGEDMARIKRKGETKSFSAPSVRITSVEIPSGTLIAEFQRKALSIHQNCTVQIVNPMMDPYLVLASLFAHPTTQNTIYEGKHTRHLEEYLL